MSRNLVNYYNTDFTYDGNLTVTGTITPGNLTVSKIITNNSGQISIGDNVGNNQGTSAVAIGNYSGYTSQGNNSIAIGNQAGYSSQGNNSIAIGYQSGFSTQGNNSIAIGNQAGYTLQHNNSIILNASGSILNSSTQNAFFVNPIRSGGSGNILVYDSGTKEIQVGGNSSMGSLTVYGNIGTSTVGTLDIGSSGNPFNNLYINNIYQPSASNALTFNTNSNERMRILSSGNVGIGTTSPGTTLQIAGTTTTQNILPDSNGTRDFGSYDYKYNTLWGQNMYLHKGSVPTAYLHQSGYSLNPASDTDCAILQFATECSTSAFNLSPNKYAQIKATTRGGSAYHTPSLYFCTKPDVSTAIATRMVITEGGQVGIGTTTPSTILDVNGVTTIRGDILPEALGTRNIGSSSAYFNSINVNNIVTNTTGRISIGDDVGINNQGGSSIAIGNFSGTTYQGANSVAIGNQSGSSTQGAGSISIGYQSGYSGQGINSISLGYQAGYTGQGNYAISIGYQAGYTGQNNNSIILNASGSVLNSATQNAFYVNPIRNDTSQTQVLYYNTSTKEVVYNSAVNASTLVLQSDSTNGSYYVPFSKTSTGGALYTSSLTFNPSNSTLSSGNFSASGSIIGGGISSSGVISAAGGYNTPDIRSGISGSSTSQSSFKICFGTFNNGYNNISGGYSDSIILNSWSNNSGGLENILMCNKSDYGIRLFQGYANSGNNSVPYTRFSDVLMKDASGNLMGSTGNLKVGNNSNSNYIAFNGTTGDNPGGYNNTYIGERIYSPNENSELFLYKGNDAQGLYGPDRIRMASSEIRFDTYSSITGNSSFEDTANSSSLSNKMLINQSGQVGIGTTNPSTGSILDVNGNTTIRGNLNFLTNGKTIPFIPKISNTITQRVFGETLKKDIISFNNVRCGIKTSDIDFYIDNYLDGGQQEYTFGKSIQNMWVAVGGASNSIAYSMNGKKWFPVSTLFSSWGGGVCWNGTIWVAIGNGTVNTLAYSYDGITWTGIGKSVITGVGYGVCWNGSIFVAVGQTSGSAGVIVYSYDGINWINSGATIFTTLVRKVDWNGYIFVAVGSGTNSIGYSYDGKTWSASTNSTSIFTQGYGICWSGNTWVAVGQGTNTVAYSSDGVNWSGLNVFSSAGLGVSWNGNMFVAVGGNTDTIAYSYDGLNWVGRGNSTLDTLGYDVKWNGNMWLACGSGTNKMVYSYNGINWRAVSGVSSIFNSLIIDIAFNSKRENKITLPKNMIVAGGEGTNTLAYSYDGSNWTAVSSSPFSAKGYGSAWNGKMWIAGGNGTNTLAYSYDGINWTGLGTRAFGTNCYSIIWGGNIWVAGGDGSSVLSYSYDGFTWTQLGTTIFDTNCKNIDFNGSLFVAVGKTSTYGVIASSSDGVNWIVKNSNNIFTTSANAIKWNGKLWVAGGSGNNTLAYSPDGTNWTGLGTSIFTGTGVCSDINWNEKIWVAVGQNIAIFNITSITGTSLVVSSVTSGTIQIGMTLSGGSISSGTYIVSGSGLNWVVSSSQTIGAIVVTGTQGMIAYSYDGLAWTQTSITGTGIFSSSGNNVKWIGNMWIAGGNGTANTLAYSYDGINWTGLGISKFTTGSYGIGINKNLGNVYLNHPLVSVGSGTYNTLGYSSNDGLNWVGLGKSIFSTQGNKTCWNGNMWVAGGSGTNTLAYSSDGINWVGLGTSIFSNSCNNIKWTGSNFVAVGEGLVSFTGSINDGINSSNGTLLSVTSVSSGTLYVGMFIYGTGVSSGTRISNFISGTGQTGTYRVNINQNIGSIIMNGTPISVAYSPDGINWTPTQNQIATGGNAIISGNGISGSGFTYHIYTSGYFNDDPTWFSTRTESYPVGLVTDMSSINASTNKIVPADGSLNSYSVKWDGYFYAPTNESYTFYTNSDDASYLWIGQNASYGYTTSNALVNNGGVHGMTERSGSISLVAGTYYPFLVQFGDSGGGDNCIVSFSTPTISKTNNFSGYAFSGIVIKNKLVVGGYGNSSFTGTISGTTLNVSGMTSGILYNGMTLTGGSTLANTKISGLITGSGGTGLYNVTTSNTISSGTSITGSLPLGAISNFTGSISQDILTVSSISSGIIHKGMTLSTSNSSPTSNVLSNTIVKDFITGSGGTGTYSLLTLQPTNSTSISVIVGNWCKFTGSISGSTLTVSAITGSLFPSMILNSGTTGNLTYGIIVNQLTGSTGGVGTYKLSITQGSTISSMRMYAEIDSALFTASASGTTLTVSSVLNGYIWVGMTLVTNLSVGFTSCTISSQSSGTSGGVGVYVLSTSQGTINSTTFSGSFTSFSGTISGSILTVTGNPTSNLSPGMTIYGPGATPCTIIDYISGSGQAGNYLISISQTVSTSSTFTAQYFHTKPVFIGTMIMQTLTVSSITTGNIRLGMLLTGNSILNDLHETLISSYVSSNGIYSNGGIGQYTISENNNITSGTIIGKYYTQTFNASISGATLICEDPPLTIYDGAPVFGGNICPNTFISESNNTNNYLYGIHTLSTYQIIQSTNTFTGTLNSSSFYGTITDNVLTVQNSRSNNNLTYNYPISGYIYPGMILSGYGIPPNTEISSFGTGTGGTGTYNLLTRQQVSSSTITGSGNVSFVGNISGKILSVTSTSGKILIGMIVTGIGISADTVIVSFLSGINGGVGNYLINNTQTISSISLLAIPTFSSSFSASISSSTLSVSSVSSGTLIPGMIIIPTYFAPGIVVTKIVSNGTGSGGSGTYNLSNSSNSSGTVSMTAVIPFSFSPTTTFIGSVPASSNQLTISSISTGSIYIGMSISASGFTTCTIISGPTGGGTGTYTLSTTQASAGTNLSFSGTLSPTTSFTGSLSGTTNQLVVSSISNGAILIGMQISGSGFTTCNVISGPSSGGAGTYTLSTSQASATTSFNGSFQNTTSFTASVSASSNQLVVSSISTGTILIGMQILCTNFTTCTIISGPSGGGVGTYTLSLSQPLAVSSGSFSGSFSTGLTFSSSISDSTLTVTGTPSQNLYIGMSLTSIDNGFLLPNTYITSLGTGTGGAGTYNLTIKKSFVVSEIISGSLRSFNGRIDNGTVGSAGTTLTMIAPEQPQTSTSGSVSSWNTFSQATSAQPTFDLYSVNFNRTNSQFLSNSNLSFNIQTNGGLTAIAYVNFTGTAQNSERIFDFGLGQQNENLIISRGSGTSYNFVIFNGTSAIFNNFTGTITQNSWHTVSFRYSYSGGNGTLQTYINKILSSSVTSATQITNKNLTSNYIGKSNWTNDPYLNGSVRGLLVYDRALSDFELNTATDSLVYGNTNFSKTNLVVNLTMSDSIPTTVSGTSGPIWGLFSQATTANQPTFDSNSVNFNRANSQYLSNSNLSFNINTNGGFTAIAYVKFRGTAGLSERIFDFANATSGFNDNLLLCRSGTSSSFYVSLGNGSTQTVTMISSSGDIVQDQWMTISVRYTKSNTTLQLFKNKISTGTPVTNVGIINDRTSIYNNIGKSNTNVSEAYFNGSIRGFLVYDRALSNSELNTAIDSLLNFNQNYSTTNLVVNLQINLPLYTGMYLTKGTTNTSISTSTSNVIYTVNNSQSLTSTSILVKPFADPSFTTGSISGTTLTATGTPSGLYPGVSLNALNLSPNTFISTGTTGGGAGTYTLVTYQNNTPTNGGTLTSINYTYDLTSWNSISSNPFTSTINDIYWDGVYYIAVGSGSTTMSYSSDLFTWNNLSTFTTQGNSIFSNGIIWVAVGNGTNSIYYSTNGGTTWTAVSGSSSIFSTSGNSISWTGKRWLAGGSGTNTFAYSNNGQTWYANGSGSFSTQTNAICSNPMVGSIIVDSQIIIDSNGNGLSDNLELVSDKYYNSEYNAFSMTIKSRPI